MTDLLVEREPWPGAVNLTQATTHAHQLKCLTRLHVFTSKCITNTVCTLPPVSQSCPTLKTRNVVLKQHSDAIADIRSQVKDRIVNNRLLTNEVPWFTTWSKMVTFHARQTCSDTSTRWRKDSLQHSAKKISTEAFLLSEKRTGLTLACCNKWFNKCFCLHCLLLISHCSCSQVTVFLCMQFTLRHHCTGLLLTKFEVNSMSYIEPCVSKSSV